MTHDDTVTRLWGELSGSLRSWFVRRTGDEHEAADLLSECFLRVHDRLGDVHDGEHLTAWIRGIARNLPIDQRRRRHEQSVVDSTEFAGPAEEPSLDAVVASWLAPMIEELGPADRETLQLTELQGLTQREAADRLGISLPALKSRVLRGRARLRTRILACCELEFDRRGGIVAYRKPCASRCSDS